MNPAELIQERDTLRARVAELEAALRDWGVLYNTPPLLEGLEWNELFTDTLATTVALLARAKQPPTP